MAEIKLKPCPICGGEEIVYGQYEHEAGTAHDGLNKQRPLTRTKMEEPT